MPTSHYSAAAACLIYTRGHKFCNYFAQLMPTTMDIRKQCPFCKEDLASSAYYRHTNDQTGYICPGKKTITSQELLTGDDDEMLGSQVSDNDTDSSLLSMDLNDESDSSFKFDSSDDQVMDPLFDNNESRGSEISSNDLDEEIWTDTDEDDSENVMVEEANNVFYCISLFLNYYQLTYHISERAMMAILTFLRLLFVYLGTLTQTKVMQSLADVFPKSLYSIRKKIDHSEHKLIQHAACPKCHSLKVYQVPVNENDQNCEFIEFPMHPQSSRRQKCNTPLYKAVRVNGKSNLVPRKSFYYHSLLCGIEDLMSNKDFLVKCELWRQHVAVSNGMYAQCN